MTPAEQHAYDAGRLADLMAAASPDDWANPSPVAGWAALHVVQHLIEWLPGFLAGVTLPLIEPAAVAADPAGAWRRRTADVQRLIAEHGEELYASPRLGEMPLARAIAQFYVTDVWMHSWDLAKALGLEPDLGEERCEVTLAAIRPLDDVLREGGQFAPKVAVPDDACAQDRLIGFIGRDPAWQR